MELLLLLAGLKQECDMKRGFFILIILIIAGTACAPAPSPTPAIYIPETPTQTPAWTPSPVPSETPLPTETPLQPTRIPDRKASALDGMVQRIVPAGTFKMGSEAGDPDEAPLHTVYLDAIYMDAFEVTYAQFRTFMEGTGHTAAPCGYGNIAVTCVNWFDAQAYCEWAGRRLPTEAEWEKAARGGLNSSKFPWGDTEPNCENNGGEPIEGIFILTGHANFDWLGRGCINRPIAGGEFEANGYGLYDMAGNVWEWTLDWYGFYTHADQNNPAGPAQGEHKVIRGGSWVYSSYYLRNASRSRTDPATTTTDIGFRCAESLPAIE